MTPFLTNPIRALVCGAAACRGKIGRFVILLSCLVAVRLAAIPAFPGAEGAGANALGGRGGDVYYVTTLTDNSSAGSLRYGIANAPSGGRTILFKVSDNIVLNSSLTVNKPRITIAGQMAPGAVTRTALASNKKTIISLPTTGWRTIH